MAVGAYYLVRAVAYPRPYLGVVEESGVDISLVYAVAKAESGFDEEAQSRAGAMGLMQLMPATAEFICRTEGMTFELERLKEGEYNLTLGVKYLRYLLGRFSAEQTALAAYNAGEGVVAGWLKKREYSEDGKTLVDIPYPETAAYVKKVEKFRKNYDFFY
ncbi:MAG: lytic transglycosylase domain-containing protein [Clostridiales bacterium]|nr:lytic transglycosylase domain-containing protein [Clostridiales bacterium]